MGLTLLTSVEKKKSSVCSAARCNAAANCKNSPVYDDMERLPSHNKTKRALFFFRLDFAGSIGYPPVLRLLLNVRLKSIRLPLGSGCQRRPSFIRTQRVNERAAFDISAK